jgi:hypothetical protein
VSSGFQPENTNKFRKSVSLLTLAFCSKRQLNITSFNWVTR